MAVTPIVKNKNALKSIASMSTLRNKKNRSKLNSKQAKGKKTKIGVKMNDLFFEASTKLINLWLD